MDDNFYKKSAIKKGLFSLFIVSIYLLGCNIFLPNIDSHFYSNIFSKSATIGLSLGMTGLSLENISLFSLGVGPWMATLILWRILSISKIFRIDSLTSKQSFQIKIAVCLSLGLVQAAGIIKKLTPLKGRYDIPAWALIFILLTGLLIIIWLGNLNSKYGIGGLTIIIIVNMLKKFPNILSSYKGSNVFIGVSFFFFLILYMFFIFRFYQGERRIPLINVMLDDNQLSKSYLPISSNPAGAMPFMYAFSLLMIPQFASILFESNRENNDLYYQLQLNQPLGIATFLLTLFFITFIFSYFNIDYKNISENMKKSGDYFPNVYPGKNTEKYLFHKIFYISSVASTFNILVVGLPLLYGFIFNKASEAPFIILNLIMVLLLMREICVKLRQAYYRNSYQNFVESDALYK